ncbi:MAG TPA: hypothetical protein VG457_11235, partial [Planctomycetota bacterium]|nr:hypothetical protein [Planctomycetota bacterium]
DGVLTLSACIGTVDGRRLIRSSQAGVVDHPLEIARSVETALVSAGAHEILAQLAPARSPKKARSKR